MRIFASMTYDKVIDDRGMIELYKNNNFVIEIYFISNKRFTFEHQ
jgi:hypothetical protein